MSVACYRFSPKLPPVGRLKNAAYVAPELFAPITRLMGVHLERVYWPIDGDFGRLAMLPIEDQGPSGSRRRSP
jgi:hypothetical protein